MNGAVRILKSRILIVCGMQDDYIYGLPRTQEAKAIPARVLEKMRQYREDPDGCIILMRYTQGAEWQIIEKGLYPCEGQPAPNPGMPLEYCLWCSAGWEFLPGFEAKEADKVIVTTGFAYDDWHSEFGRGYSIAAIEIVGLRTDVCVASNALALRSLYPRAKISVDAECCAGTSPEGHAAALEVMQACRIEVIEKTQ